jgi:hypothetical protein
MSNLLPRQSRRKPFIASLSAVVATVAVASVIGLMAAVPSHGTDFSNLLPGGSIKNSDGLIGLVGEPFDGGDWTYSEIGLDATWQASDVNCEETYDLASVLCDPAPTTDVRGTLTQNTFDVGLSWDMVNQSSIGYVVVDLGQASTFSSLEVFQMMTDAESNGADGQTTRAELFVSNADTDTWPTQGGGSWTSVVSGAVANGTLQPGTGPLTNTSVTTFDFDAISGRYVMLYLENDGTYDEDSYIEAAGVKLFGYAGAPPEATGEPSLAATGFTGAPLGIAALLLLVGGAVLVIRGRQAAAK